MTYDEHNGYYVGQEVVIRDWEDMAQEFGELPNGILCNDLGFLKDMRQFCGQHFTISALTDIRVRFFESTSGCAFNYAMIKPAEESLEEDPAVIEAFTSGLEVLLTGVERRSH